MDLAVVTYLLYLAITVPLTIWVARALHRHGQVFLIDVFNGDERLANAVNQLLVIGFYLLNFGFLSFFMASETSVDSTRAGARAALHQGGRRGPGRRAGPLRQRLVAQRPPPPGRPPQPRADAAARAGVARARPPAGLGPARRRRWRPGLMSPSTSGTR